MFISPKFAQILKHFAQSCDCMIAAFRNSGPNMDTVLHMCKSAGIGLEYIKCERRLRRKEGGEGVNRKERISGGSKGCQGKESQEEGEDVRKKEMLIRGRI